MATLTQVFTSLADKIRSKLGTTTKYTPAQAISAIDDVYEKGKSEGTTPTQEKTVTAGTSASTVTPDSGYALSKVTVNPTPSQTKSVTAGTSDKTVSPDSGKLLSSVTVSPTPSQTKSASPSTSAQTITPDSGKLLSSVSISAISPQRNPTTANQATLTGYNSTGPYVWFPAGWWPAQDNTHGSYVYMTQAQAQQAHEHTGTRATVTANGTIDLGAIHGTRYVPVNVSAPALYGYYERIVTVSTGMGDAGIRVEKYNAYTGALVSSNTYRYNTVGSKTLTFGTLTYSNEYWRYALNRNVYSSYNGLNPLSGTVTWHYTTSYNYVFLARA